MATLDYELILMLDPQAGDEQRDKIAADAKSRIDSQGEVKHEENWGTRKMAYEIDKRGDADYRVWRFTGAKPLLDDLDHSLKITDGVLRFRIFKVPADSPNIVPPDTEQIMRRDEDDRDRGRGRGRDDRGGSRRPPRADTPSPAEPADAPPPAEAADATPAADSAAPADAAPAEAAEAAPAEAAPVPEAPAGDGGEERSDEVAPASAAGSPDAGA